MVIEVRPTRNRCKVSGIALPLPERCAEVVKRLRPVYGRLPVPKQALRAELAYWWLEVVPENWRHARTDIMAAILLAAAADPLRLVRWWIATGDYQPWLMVPRTLAVIGAQAEPPDGPAQGLPLFGT